MNTEQKKYDVCPICGSSIHVWRTKKVGDETFEMDQCDKCHFCFVNPRPSMEYLANFYSEAGHGETANSLEEVLGEEKHYPNSIADAKRIVRTINDLLPKTIQHKTFLDVGSGYGFFTQEAIQNGFDVTAIELAKIEKRISQKMTNVEPVSVTFEDFKQEGEQFDALLFSQILEHARDINEWITKANHLLKKGGMIAIALPNFENLFRLMLQENECYICPPAHLNYFTEKNLSLLLEKHGFKVRKVEWNSRFLPKTFEKRLKFLGQKGSVFVTDVFNFLLKGLNLCHVGIMLNVYAEKVDEV